LHLFNYFIFLHQIFLTAFKGWLAFLFCPVFENVRQINSKNSHVALKPSLVKHTFENSSLGAKIKRVE